MGWKDKLTFRQSQFVDHEVQGSKLRFYPNRIRVLHVLADVSRPVAAALASLFADQSRDSALNEKTMTEGETLIRESSVAAVSVDTIKMRAKEREDAIAKLVDAVSDKRNRLLIGQLLMDSLREEFPAHTDRPVPEVEEFLYGDGEGYEGIDLPTMGEMLTGWIKANSKVFGPVGEQVAARLGASLGGKFPSDSPSTGPTPTPGSSSRTESSQPSPEGSLSSS
jgi:hypothetical protein